MDDLEQLLERYLASRLSGKDAYFDVDEIIALVNYFFEDEDYDNVNNLYRLGLELHPNDIDFEIGLYEAIVRNGDYETSLKGLEHIPSGLRVETDVLKIESLLGLLRYDDAMALFEEIRAANVPHIEELYSSVACMHNEVQQYYLKGSEFIEKALQVYPDNFELKLERGLNCELLGKLKEALEQSKELVDIDPFSAEAWYLLGRVYFDVFNYEKSLEAFDFALSAGSDDPTLLIEIKAHKASILYKTGSYEESIALFDEMLSTQLVDPDDVNAFVAKSYMKLGDFEKAFELLSPFYENDEDDCNESVYGDLVYCCIETGRREYALEVLCEGLKKFPHSILEYLAEHDYSEERNEKHKQKLEYPTDLVSDFMSTNLHNN
jgi:tetratricopeptide (TPR) repeat protein